MQKELFLKRLKQLSIKIIPGALRGNKKERTTYPRSCVSFAVCDYPHTYVLNRASGKWSERCNKCGMSCWKMSGRIPIRQR